MADEPTTNSSFMRKKVGGIPVIYLLGVGVLILAIVAYRMKNKAAAVDTTPTDTTSDPSTDSAIPANLTDTGGFLANPAPVASSIPTVGNSTVTDNAMWVRKSVEYLVSTGVSPGDAQVALQTWLGGDQLSYEQGLIRDKAVKQFGMPPEDFIGGGTTKQGDKPAKVQGPLPRVHVVQNSNDNTYLKLANLYYHSGGNPDAARLIKAANTPQAPWGESDTIPIGGHVNVPKWITPKYFTATAKIDTLAKISAKNGVNQKDIQELNPGMRFPVRPGTAVRVH